MSCPSKNHWYLSLSLLLCMLIVMPTHAQQAKRTYTIKGTAFDSKTSEPLIGANVILEATVFGAATDQEGRFSITGSVFSGRYKLVYRLIGYKKESRDVELAAEQTVDVGRTGLTLSGRNLFSVDKYRGYDPEVNVASQSTLVRGFDWSTIPLPRTWSFGITANL